MEQIIITAVVGVITGAIGSLVAPWVNWGIERRRLRLQARRAVIDRWREMLRRVSKESDGDFGNLLLALHDDVDFLSLRQHLGEQTQAILDGGEAPDHEVFEALLADISRVESEWQLI